MTRGCSAALTTAAEVLLDAHRRGLLAWAGQEVRRSGEVPVLVILGDSVISTTLSRLAGRDPDAESSAWSMPMIGEAVP